MKKIELLLIFILFFASSIYISYRFGLKEGRTANKDKIMKDIQQILQAQGINVELKRDN